MTQFAVPPVYADYSKTENMGDRTIFLAGPIQGADDWQAQACKNLNFPSLDLVVANPRRSDKTWEFQFDIQVDWEVFHLDKAAEKGSVLFYLSKEAQHNCDRAYAQTTRLELGWMMAMHKAGFCKNLIICYETGFTGLRYIKRRLATDRAFADVILTDCLAMATSYAHIKATCNT